MTFTFTDDFMNQAQEHNPIKIVNAGDEWLDVEPPPTEPIFDGFVDLRQRVAVIGGSKRRKSFIVATAAILSAAGRDGIGLKTAKPRITVLVQFEIETTYMWRRTQKLCRSMNITKENLGGRLFIVNLRDQLDNEGFEDAAIKIIFDAMLKTKAQLLIIDPIYVLNTGEENETKSMRTLLRKLGTLCRETGSGLMYAMHDKKSGQYDQELTNRGSGTGLTARDYDGAMFLSPHASGDDELTVVEFIVRHAPPRPAYCLRWEWDEGSHHFVVTDDAPEKALKAKKPSRDPADYIGTARQIITAWKEANPSYNGQEFNWMPKADFKSAMLKHLSENACRDFMRCHIYDADTGTGSEKSPIRAYSDKAHKNRKMVDNSISYKYGS